MKMLLIGAIAIAVALSSLAMMAVQSVMALDVGPGASSFSPGTQHAGVSQPSDPYLGAPGTVIQHENPADPYRFSPGQLFLNSGISTGPG